MIDLYEILELDPSKSLTEIQEYLERNRTIWENNAHNRGDAESILKVRSLKEADIVFSSQVNRDRYDKELQEFLNPPIQSDPREVKCQEYLKKAEVYVKNKEFDLAEKAINQAMSYREDSNIKVLKMAAHINDCLDNTEQALNYINEAIVIKPTDQQSYKLKLLILLHDFDIAKSVKFFDGTKLDQKKEATKQYILEGFIRGMNPQSDKEYLDSCDFILKSIKKSKHGSGFRALFNSTYKDSYRKMALSVREEKHYRVAVSQFYALSSDNGWGTLQYCKSILKRSPNSQIAREYIEQYERDAEERRILQEKAEKERLILEKERRILQEKAEKERRILQEKAEKELRYLKEQQKQLEKTISQLQLEIKNLETSVSHLRDVKESAREVLSELRGATNNRGVFYQIVMGIGITLYLFVGFFFLTLIVGIFTGTISSKLMIFGPIITSIIITIINIFKVLQIPNQEKQVDSLNQQIKNNEQKIRSLEDSLRSKEQSYRQLKQDIYEASKKVSNCKNANRLKFSLLPAK
ncbi:TPA: hypothetical protein ACGO3V_000664 [Streptococcus suis]